MRSGIVNIYKPSGISSSAAVGRVKRALGTRAVGHMGTLDPIGEGVLLMGVGKGTRLFEYMLGKSKTYEARFRFGATADTLDRTGVVTSTTDIIPDEKTIRDALPLLVGEYDQLPPLYSAKSVDGVRAYKLARNGLTPELKRARVRIDSFELIERTDDAEWLFRIDCSSGTYIRSLCRDLAEKCGSLALMTSIKRTRCGAWYASDAIAPDEITEADIIPLADALFALPRFDAPDEEYKKLSNGVPVPSDDAPVGKCALYCHGELFGIAENADGTLRLRTYLKEDNAYAGD